jgi:Ca2+-binding RTX toxin-like protein
VPIIVFGGDGNDFLESGSKTDTLSGGAGADTLVAAGDGSIIGNYIGGSGKDRIQNLAFSGTVIPRSWFKSNGVEGILMAQGGRFTTS